MLWFHFLICQVEVILCTLGYIFAVKMKWKKWSEQTKHFTVLTMQIIPLIKKYLQVKGEYPGHM
jgi:hypothetical protein